MKLSLAAGLLALSACTYALCCSPAEAGETAPKPAITRAKDLLAQEPTTTTAPGTTQDVPPATGTSPAQVSPAEAGVARPGINYIGAALSVGLGGETNDPLGGATVGAIVSKFRLINLTAFEISFRPQVLLATNSQIQLQGTIDFIREGVSQTVAPYIGLGASLGTGGNESAFLLTGGADIRINATFTALAQISAGFFSQTGVGLLLGGAVNF